MRTLLVGGTIQTPAVTLQGHTVVIEDGKIAAIAEGTAPAAAGDLVVDATGLWVAPGFIDIHVHGAVEADTMDATPAAIHAMARFFASCGVTAYYPTTMSGWPAPILAAIENVARCPQPADGAHHLGVHVEGPYLNPAFKGAQPEAYLRDADPAEYNAWLASGIVKLITLAPERAGSLALVEQGVAQDIEFAIGHSAASYEQVVTAADHGVRQGTHTFNGMLGLHHRDPGTVGGVLAEDRIYVQVIADGVHLHPAIVKLIVRAKTPARTILITDAMRATGCPDGDYELGGEPVRVAGGIARNAAGSLAGSTLTMAAAVRNVMAFTGLSFAHVLPMATATPAAAMHLAGKKGVITPGADADLVLLDADFRVQRTIVAGETVFEKPGNQSKTRTQ